MAIFVDPTYVQQQVAAVPRHLEAIFTKSDTLTVLVGALPYVCPVGCALLSVSVAAGSVKPVGSSVIVDVNKNGTTIFGVQANRPALAPGANSVIVPASQASVTAFAAGDLITIDIDQIGSTTPGTGIVTQVELTPLT